MAVLTGSESIREVIAFPKTMSGQDPLFGCPAPVGDMVDFKVSPTADGRGQQATILQRYGIARAPSLPPPLGKKG